MSDMIGHVQLSPEWLFSSDPYAKRLQELNGRNICHPVGGRTPEAGRVEGRAAPAQPLALDRPAGRRQTARPD